jgi:hypothetical protein
MSTQTTLAKATMNAQGNLTIGHYVLGRSHSFRLTFEITGKALGKGTFG